MRLGLLCTMFACISYGMQQRQPSLYYVTPECKEQLQQVQGDVSQFYRYCCQCFQEARSKDPHACPSSVLYNVVARKSPETVGLRHATPSFYVNAFLNSSCENLDRIFQEQSREHDSDLAWYSVSEELQGVLRRESVQYQHHIIQFDQRCCNMSNPQLPHGKG